MDRDWGEEQRRSFEEMYRGLSPEERRQRIVLEPAYRDGYNELIQAERIAVVPQYFWEKWVPVLGPVASMLYMRLRQYCYWNPTTGESRIECWPKQSTLAREIGVKDRKTIRTALVLLESHGFIERKTTYHLDAAGRPHQGSDHYLVFFEVPLVAQDAAELLIRQTTPKGEDGGSSYEGKKSPHRTWAVGKSPYGGKISPHIAGEKIPSRTSTRTSTSNVTNVGKTSYGENALRGRPEVQALNSAERAGREGLAQEIGESLKTWDGAWDGQGHRSEGFHRRIAFLLPEQLVRQALAATRDAVERKRSGQGGCTKGPAAYFAGVAKKLAEEAGIDLGLQARKGPEGPTPAPQRPQEARKAPSPPQAAGEPEISAEEAKARFKALVRQLADRQT
jgi:hypothetical protein